MKLLFFCEICQILHVIFGSTSTFYSKFCIDIQCDYTQLTFWAQTLCTLVKTSTLKCKFLRFLSARVKIRQILHVNFELTNQFLFKFSIIVHCHDTQLPCKFWAHTFSNFDRRIPSKSQFWNFREFWWKFAKFLMSFFKQQVSFSLDFTSLSIVIKDNSSVHF